MWKNTGAVTATLVVTLLCVGLVAFALSSYHSSDRVLTERFYEHEADFYLLANRANEESQGKEAVFLRASMDFPLIGETDGEITEKGYVYSPKPISHSLVDSLDHLETGCPAIYFKQLNDDWYLYYECSISKPE